MKVTDVIPEVIRLADAIRDYYDRESPKRHPKYPFIQEGEGEVPPPPEEQALEKLFTSLPEEVLYKLYLVARLSWREFDPRHLAERYEALRAEEPDAAWVHGRLMDWVSLGSDLIEGLEELKRQGVEVDPLPAAKLGA